MTLVDVVISCHDPSRPVARAVASVLEGTEAPSRVLVVAHNVPAGEIEVALGDWARDARVSVVELLDGLSGPSSPKNYGLFLATSPYVTMVDSDDTLELGAIDRWLAVAQREKADFVIANRRDAKGPVAASPPVRVGRRHRLLGSRDRLAYRASAFGLARRSRFGCLRFPEAVPTGEDIPFTASMWFSGARISFAFGSPGYVLHDDQPSRATTTRRSTSDELKWLDPALDPHATWMRDTRDRTALVVKLLRRNLPDTARTRLPGAWDEEARHELARAARRLGDADQRALDYLSCVDWELWSALESGAAAEEHVARLIRERDRTRSLRGLVPHRPELFFARQAPLRTHLAARALLIESHLSARFSELRSRASKRFVTKMRLMAGEAP